jgi:hypothetical protein
MSSERFWVLLLTLTAFGAGVAAGVLLTLRRMPVPDTRPFAAYEARLTETFDLDERRVAHDAGAPRERSRLTWATSWS